MTPASSTDHARELEALAKRVARASGPDPELDSAIWKCVASVTPGYESDANQQPIPITASLDAALGLVDRLLPQWRWKLQQIDKGTVHFKCTLEPRTGSPARGYHEKAAPLAVIDALLRALLDHLAK